MYYSFEKEMIILEGRYDSGSGSNGGGGGSNWNNL